MTFSSQLGEAQVSVRATTDKLRSDLNKAKATVSSSVKKMQSSMRSIGIGLSAAVTAPLVLFGKSAVKAAADAEEMEDKLGIVFGNSAESVRAWADATAAAVGRSSNAIRSAATDTQSLLISAGLTAESATQLSKSMTQLALDTASFNNVSDERATAAFRSALLGENEALKGIGLSLSAVEVAQAAVNMGYEGSVAQMDSATRAMATYQALLSKTAQMQGNAAATAGSSSNQMKALSGAFSDLQIIIGQDILPVLTPLISALTQGLQLFTGLPPSMQEAALVFGVVAAAAGPLALAIGALSTPLIAVSGLVAGAFVAWQKWEYISLICQDVYEAVKTWLWDKLGPVIDNVINKVKTVTDFFSKMYDKVVGKETIPKMVDKVKKGFAKVEKAVTEPVKKAVNKVSQYFDELKERVATQSAPAVVDTVKVEFERLERVMVKPAEKATAKVSSTFENLGTSIQNSMGQAFSNLGSSLGGDIGGGALGSFLSPVMGAVGDKFGGMLSGFLGVPGKALGGPINKPHLVGERGPELFIPGRAGTVVNNDTLGSGGGVTVVQNISVNPDAQRVFKEQLMAHMPLIQQSAVSGVREAQQRKGGL